MDVERIQKINDLALSLMKQGLAQTREEAVSQAEQIFDSSKTDGYVAMRETMNKVEAEKREEPRAEQSSASRGESLDSSQVNEILEKNTNFLVKTIRDFNEKIGSMQKEIETLKTKIAYRDLPTVKEVVGQKERQENTIEINPPASNQSTQQSSQPAQQEKPQSHPRSGNYADTDVSIEKFFYMGSK